MGIDESLKNKRRDVLRIAAEYGAHNVRVFGSAAVGQAQPDSDVDILVDMEAGRSLFDLVGLWQDREDMLGRKVDVVEAEGLHWYIRDDILKEAVPL